MGRSRLESRPAPGAEDVIQTFTFRQYSVLSALSSRRNAVSYRRWFSIAALSIAVRGGRELPSYMTPATASTDDAPQYCANLIRFQLCLLTADVAIRLMGPAGPPRAARAVRTRRALGRWGGHCGRLVCHRLHAFTARANSRPSLKRMGHEYTRDMPMMCPPGRRLSALVHSGR